MIWSEYTGRNRAAAQRGPTALSGVFYPPCESPSGAVWIAESSFASVRSYGHDNEKLKMKNQKQTRIGRVFL